MATHIIIDDRTPRASFTVGATPSDGPFEIEFAVFDPETDLKVYDDGTLLTYSDAPASASQWGWVATNPVDGGHQGGEVILGGTVTNSVILVTRETAIERTSDFQYPSGSLNIQALNTQLDRLFAIHQDKDAALDRVLRQPDEDVALIDPLPAAADRANMFFAFDADGNPTVAAGVSESGTPVSSYMDASFTSANEAAFKAYHNLEAGTDFVAPTGDGSGLTHIAYSHGMALSNGKLAWSVSGNALTIAVKTLAGADPSAADPVKIAIPDGSGGVNVRTLTSALSLTISSGSTLGTSSNVAFRIWIGALDNAGTVELFAVNALSGTSILALDETGTITTTAEGGAGAADSAQVPYSASARTTKQYRLLGFGTWNSGLGTAGTWASGPSAAAIMGPGVKKPGELVQEIELESGATDTSTTVLPDDDSIPQNTEGEEWGAGTVAMTAKSPANLREVFFEGFLGGNDQRVGVALFVDTTANAIAAGGVFSRSTSPSVNYLKVRYKALCGDASAHTYKMRHGPASSATSAVNGGNSGRIFGGVCLSRLVAREIMA